MGMDSQFGIIQAPNLQQIYSDTSCVALNKLLNPIKGIKEMKIKTTKTPQRR